MPRHSGNRDAADRPNSSVHGGFSKATATRSDFDSSYSLFAQAECLQVAARGGQRHHRGTANECHGADAPRPYSRYAADQQYELASPHVLPSWREDESPPWLQKMSRCASQQELAPNVADGSI
jgi:hypothetical protein